MSPEQEPLEDEPKKMTRPVSELSAAERIELFQKIQSATGGEEERIGIVLGQIGLDRSTYLLLRSTRPEIERIADATKDRQNEAREIVKTNQSRTAKPPQPCRERAPREYIRRPLRKDRQKNPETEEELLLTLPETVRRRVACRP